MWARALMTLHVASCLVALTAAEKMQALVAHSTSERSVTSFEVPSLGDLHRRFVGLPESCEVLIAVNSSSVNPADKTTPGPYPQVMGSDLAGTVVAVEDHCTRLHVGDRVWADIGAVVTTTTSKGKENGAYGQIAVALESQLGPMPKNLGFQEAAALPKVALTSYKALAWYGGAPYSRHNGSVLILGGSGGTGTTGIQIAKALGATRIVTTTSAENVGYVKELGATEAIDYHTQNWWEIFPAGSFDVVYDTVGQEGTGDRAMKLLKPEGFYVTIVGALPSKPRADVRSTMFINSDSNLDNLGLLETLRHLVEEDKLRMRRLKAYELSEVLAAFKESAGGHVDGKLVVTMPLTPVGSPHAEVLFE